MGFKIGKFFRNVVKVAAPIVGAVVPGIGTAIAGVALAGVNAYEANKAKKRALAEAQASGNAQQIELAKRDLLADEYYQAEKKRFDEEVKRIEEEKAFADKKLLEAKEFGDAEAVRLYEELNAGLDNQRASLLNIMNEQKNIGEQYLSDQYEQTVNLLKEDIDVNRDLRQQYGLAVDQSVADIDLGQDAIKSELDRVRSETRPEELDAVHSDIEGSIRDYEAEQERINAAKGKDTPSGVSLAAAIQKAKLKGKASADLRRQFKQNKMRNIQSLSQSLNQGANLRSNLRGNRAAMREDSGAILADAGERYTDKLVQRGDQFTDQEMLIEGSTSDRKMNNLKRLREDNIDRNTAYVTDIIGNKSYANKSLTDAERDLSGDHISAMNVKLNTANQRAGIYGNAASRNFALAREARNSRNQAIKEGLTQIGGIFKKRIKGNSRYKTT